MADNGNDNPQPGGSSIGCNNVVKQQNINFDPTQQNAAAQLAQQILANTNVMLKQFRSLLVKKARTLSLHLNSSQEMTNAKSLMTRTTQRHLPI
jgi:hypothetical protein